LRVHLVNEVVVIDFPIFAFELIVILFAARSL
jgi:hypothetical protein